MGSRSTEAQQLRQLLVENPQIHTMTQLRDFVVLDRPAKYCTPEVDSAAAALAGFSIQYPEDAPAESALRMSLRGRPSRSIEQGKAGVDAGLRFFDDHRG